MLFLLLLQDEAPASTVPNIPLWLVFALAFALIAFIVWLTRTRDEQYRPATPKKNPSESK